MPADAPRSRLTSGTGLVITLNVFLTPILSDLRGNARLSPAVVLLDSDVILASIVGGLENVIAANTLAKPVLECFCGNLDETLNTLLFRLLSLRGCRFPTGGASSTGEFADPVPEAVRGRSSVTRAWDMPSERCRIRPAEKISFQQNRHAV